MSIRQRGSQSDVPADTGLFGLLHDRWKSGRQCRRDIGLALRGTARDLCLGLEVVTADGDVWNGLYKLRKNNTGYDLRDLFIGSEGTLGIITAAVLKLFPRPKAQQTAFAAVKSPEDALKLLSHAQRFCGDSLTAFELISRYSLELVTRHFPEILSPLPFTYPWYVLLELSDAESDEHAAPAV